MPTGRDTGLAVGLDIGGTKTLGVLLGPDDAVLGSVRLPTTRGVEGVVTTAAKAVRALTDEAGTGPGALVGVGIGVPGVVDPATGTVVHAVNLGFPGDRTPLAHLLSAELDGTPVQVENDLNVAALGAAHAEGAPADLAFLALGAAAAAGYPAAVALREEFALAVAAAIRILVLTTDVACVVLGGGVSQLGAQFRDAVVGVLDAQAAGSEFLASMRIGERVRLAPPGVPLAAIGAALLGRGAVG